MSIDLQSIEKIADQVKYFSLMGVQRAKSGHPGLPLGCAGIGTLLYHSLLDHHAAEPRWKGRDRFILSAGHGSMLVYSLNHLYGYKISKDELANFRQVGTYTAGHPEYELDRGVETTTGPLGQGFSNAVGVALEQKMLDSRFSKYNKDLFDKNVFVIMGDGCTQEGITNEAASLAGHLGLDNLIAIYDDNNISIDGEVSIAMSENVGDRYKALGWDVDFASDEDLSDIASKLEKLKAMRSGKPKILITKTIIGRGLDKMAGTHKVHGAPAGVSEVAYFAANSNMANIMEKRYGTKKAEELVQHIEAELESGDFSVQEDIQSLLDERKKECAAMYEQYQSSFEALSEEAKTDIASYKNQVLPEALKKELFAYRSEADATRGVSSNVLQLIAKHLPQLIGGSADLVASTKATIKDSHYVQKGDYSGRNIAFGIREHAMGAIGNGLALGEKFIPFTSTFFTFLDYMKPAVRLAAIMKLKHLFVFTHDSIYVGEDGPTHQPIEHLGSLRLVPGINTFRPANDIETALSYLHFLEHDVPAVVLGTRQGLEAELFQRAIDSEALYESFKKGAYIFAESGGTPDIILLGSGSEISTLYPVKKELEAAGKKVRLVSMPCSTLFDAAGKAYQKEILGDGNIPVFFAESASHLGHSLFYRDEIHTQSMTSFGESGPYKKVAEHFGFDSKSLLAQVKSLIK